MTDLAELLERVKAATGADREIDLALACLAFNEPEETFLTDELGRRSFGHQQRYTASLDAALALVERVLPGWAVGLETPNARYSEIEGDQCYVYLNNVQRAREAVIEARSPRRSDREARRGVYARHIFAARGETLPLALLLALLRAVAAEDSDAVRSAPVQLRANKSNLQKGAGDAAK